MQINDIRLKLVQLNFLGMVESLDSQLSTSRASELSFEERLSLMVDCEITYRDELFDSTERAALQPPPTTIWEHDVRRYLRVGTDYHVKFQNHSYSVPHTLVGEEVDVRATAGIVDVSHRGKHITSHARSYELGGRTTNPAHLDPKHKAYLDWNPEDALSEMGVIGPSCRELLTAIYASNGNINYQRRALHSLKGMARDYTPVRLESACSRALVERACNTVSVRNLLRNKLEAL